VTDSGYRLLANHGKHAHQEVPHFHIHIAGGESLPGLIVNS
jgi:diadenosine tetraphosphate (Ap4A) HIT family hydrolase